jgi:hypothetical protein
MHERSFAALRMTDVFEKRAHEGAWNAGGRPSPFPLPEYREREVM